MRNIFFEKCPFYIIVFYKILGAGEDVGLYMLIDTEPYEYVTCLRSFFGIQVAIHPTDDYPNIKNPIFVQPGHSAKIFIIPSVVTTDEAVRTISLFIHLIIIFILKISGALFAAVTKAVLIR